MSGNRLDRPSGVREATPVQSQADSFARPLRRRDARMARPARVLMRRRKPCVLARRRLLGWKVRLVVTAVLLGGEHQHRWHSTCRLYWFRFHRTRCAQEPLARPFAWAQTDIQVRSSGFISQCDSAVCDEVPVSTTVEYLGDNFSTNENHMNFFSLA